MPGEMECLKGIQMKPSGERDEEVKENIPASGFSLSGTLRTLPSPAQREEMLRSDANETIQWREEGED